MDNNLVGMKEMYDINIRLNQPLEIGGRKYDINETILSFERADMAQVNENKTHKQARGGYNNGLLIDWETDKEAVFAIKHGVLSPSTWAILSNSKLNKKGMKSVSYKEQLSVIEAEGYWFVDLKYIPNNANEKWGLQGNPENEQMPMGRREWLPLKPLPPQSDKFIFCYDMETGNRIMNFELCGNRVIFKREHRKVMVDYTFDYIDDILELDVGNKLFNGFLNLTAKITTKDFFSGEPTTAILEIPRLKMNSSIVAKLGTAYDAPLVNDFCFIGYPGEGQRAEMNSVCKLTFLNKELTGDYL